MANSGANLTPRQRRAIAALLTERDIKTAALAAGVGYRSLIRWLDDPLFRAELAGAEGATIDAATRRLLALQAPAIDTIEQTMSDPANTAWLKLKAAQAIVDYSIKLRELRNVEQRLADLETAVYGHKKET